MILLYLILKIKPFNLKKLTLSNTFDKKLPNNFKELKKLNKYLIIYHKI